MQVLQQDLVQHTHAGEETHFSIIAVITLALGIGANTAIFSVVNAVLLRALPYHNSKQLVAISSTNLSGDRDGLSAPEVQDYQTQMRSLEDLTGFQSQSVNVTGGERPDRVRGAFVTANFFKVFNLPPLIGRTFAEGEDRQGSEKLAVVNEKIWQERLNSDRNLTAKKLILNGEPYSVIGVVSSSFKQPFDPDVEVWMPVSSYPGNTGKREWRLLFGMGHLRPEATLSQAKAEATAIAGQLAQAYPKENAGRGAKLEYLRELLVGNVRPMLWLLFAAVGVILLIACANLANLLLARGLARQKEIAVRSALGASRWRLIRQLLTETTVIGLLGGAGGLLVAYWGLYGLLKLPQGFVDTNSATLDGRVLFFALAVSVITGWLFGLIPALQLARPDLQTFLKEGARGSGEGSRWNRVRGGFVVAQVALSLVMLVSAGLLLRSFDKLLRARTSLPQPPCRRSFPAPPLSRSASLKGGVGGVASVGPSTSGPPLSMSLLSRPSSVSLPSPPASRSAASLPRRRSAPFVAVWPSGAVRPLARRAWSGIQPLTSDTMFTKLEMIDMARSRCGLAWRSGEARADRGCQP